MKTSKILYCATIALLVWSAAPCFAEGTGDSYNAASWDSQIATTDPIANDPWMVSTTSRIINDSRLLFMDMKPH